MIHYNFSVGERNYLAGGAEGIIDVSTQDIADLLNLGVDSGVIESWQDAYLVYSGRPIESKEARHYKRVI